MYDWPIRVVFTWHFINKADVIETNYLLASIKPFIVYTVATEKYQSVHAVYLVAS